MGAYPLSHLSSDADGIRCKNCIEKAARQSQENQVNQQREAKQQKAKTLEKLSFFVFSFLPILGTLWLFPRYQKAKKNYQPHKKFRNAFLLNLLLSTLLFYTAYEGYLYSSKNTKQELVLSTLHKILLAQNELKELEGQYGFLEKLVKKKLLEGELQIGERNVYLEENGYHYRIFVASKNLWELSATPTKKSSVNYRFYMNQKGEIRYEYNKEATGKSPIFPKPKSFLFHLLHHSWLSKFLNSNLKSLFG